MANDTIDSDLRQKAVKEIFDQLNRESPVSAAAKERFVNVTMMSASESFVRAWYTARDMQREQNAFRAEQVKKNQPEPLDERRLANLLPEDAERMRVRHAERARKVTESFEKNFLAFEQNFRNRLISLFTDRGMTKETAGKVVDLVKEMTKDE